MLEATAGIDQPKPWREVVIDIGETVEEVFEREGIGPEDPVIVNVIYPGRPLVPLNELRIGLMTQSELIENVRARNSRASADAL